MTLILFINKNNIRHYVNVDSSDFQYLIGERAMNWRSCKELHISTEIVPAPFAEITSPATYTGLKSYPITRYQVPHFTPDFFYDPSTLMPNDHRLFYNEMCTP